jgi:hypothetical protein
LGVTKLEEAVEKYRDLLRPRPGEPITMIWSSDQVIRGAVIDVVFCDDAFGVRGDAGFRRLNACDEGGEWIRGHHADDSDEVTTLWVAYALT